MKGKVLKSSIILVIIMVLFGAVGWLLFSPCPPGKFCIVDAGQSDVEIPEGVREDANSLASEFFGSDSVGCDTFVDNLLEVYSAAEGKDFLLIFNSGGQGHEEIGPEWGSILDGIEEELGRLGYTHMLLIYERTFGGFWNFAKELTETFLSYPSKGKPLAAQIGFLTEHIEDIRVILLGESSGAMVGSQAMKLLQANDRVYSVQTGIPFYYRRAVSDRALVMNSNGIDPDSLSNGDLWRIFRANLGRIPTYRPEEGHFLLYLRTPGHIYTWDHPGVNSPISSFLEKHFGGN